MTERRPIMDWDSQEPWAEGIVWWTRLDQRYQIEVQRSPEPQMTEEGVDIPDAAYHGTLCVFDHDHENTLLSAEPVQIAYGAPFGPDLSDVARWQELAIDFVDGQ